jgi:hypothetical protein
VTRSPNAASYYLRTDAMGLGQITNLVSVITLGTPAPRAKDI